jgi:hypothetical protein
MTLSPARLRDRVASGLARHDLHHSGRDIGRRESCPTKHQFFASRDAVIPCSDERLLRVQRAQQLGGLGTLYIGK